MLKKILAFLAMLYAAASFAAVDVNKATAAELDGVKGIGPAISGKIVEERKKGNFKDWQDFIDRVKGVGEGNAAKFSAEGLTVNGASFKGAAAKTDDKKATTSAAKTAKAEDKPAAAASAAKEDKKDAKAEAKAEAKAKKDADKKAKAEAKAEAKAQKTAAKEAKPAASAASAKK
jgi:competence protein ComEA